MSQPNISLLKTIAMYTLRPDRLFYTRCWGCGKRRFFAQWWEGYQSNPRDEAAATAHWGYFCAPCIVIIAGMVNDQQHDGF